MDEPYDPDPLGMGIAVGYLCVGCGRGRDREVWAARQDGLQHRDSDRVEIEGHPCACGEVVIRMIYYDNINRDEEGEL